MPMLTIREGDDERIYSITESVTTIGRAEDNAIRLDDPQVEEHHCQIELTPEAKYKIVDLQTRRGTSVNGEQVNFRVLEDQDEIVLGRTILIFSLAQDTAAIPVRPGPMRFRLRRRGALRRKRVIVPPKEKRGPTFTYEDLRVVFDSLIEQNGPASLEEIRKIFDEHYESHHGTPLFDHLAQDRENLFKLIDVIKFINSQHDLKTLLDFIMDTAIEMTAAERGFLILRDQEKGTLNIKVARNFDREGIKKPEFKISKTIADQVISSGNAFVSADAMSDSKIGAAQSVTELKLRSIACVPFKFRDEVIGCMYIDNRLEPNMFTEEDLPLLQAFADQCAIAIQNAQIMEELKASKAEVERLNTMLKERVENQYAELVKMREDLSLTQKAPDYKYDYSHIIGRSRAMREVFSILDKIIDQETPVLILGESGTGKELIARAIHANSKRKNNRFVSQNCAAIPESLLESELFGHEKGAFTGAVATRPGLFEMAHKGTLFLDEIGDMSVEMQAKLLRAIEYGEVRRVGAQSPIKVDVRFISATNKDLKEAVKAGKFREDLFYRLNVVTIKLPPLRERREDIPMLVDFFLDKIAKKENAARKKIDDLVLWYLQNYDWPGNVRELENEIQRAWALSGDTITLDVLKEEVKNQRLFKPATLPPSSAATLKDIVKNAIEELERKVILEALAKTGWKKSETARMLGISRPTLDAKIQEYGLEKPVP